MSTVLLLEDLDSDAGQMEAAVKEIGGYKLQRFRVASQWVGALAHFGNGRPPSGAHHSALDDGCWTKRNLFLDIPAKGIARESHHRICCSSDGRLGGVVSRHRGSVQKARVRKVKLK